MNSISLLKRLLPAAMVIAACCLLATPMRGDTVINTINGNVGYANVGGDPSARRSVEAAWSQASAFTNVSVAAVIDPGGSETDSHSFSGVAFLTNQVGPGTTAANEIGHAPFAVTGTAFNPTTVTLFTALTLPAGTYYLILTAAVGQSGGWETASFPTLVVAAPGVTLVDAHGIGLEPPYPPASLFLQSRSNAVEFRVTGNAVAPEPATMTLAAIGLALVLGRRRK